MTTKRFFYEKYKEMVNSVSGPMTQSSFQTTGKLTPQEFVESGDALVQKFPAWEWAGGAEAVLPFLPKDKKYLVLRQCPCRERASAMLADAPEGDGGDDWVISHADYVPKKKAVEAVVAEEDEDFKWSDDDEDDAAAPAAAAGADAAGDKSRLYDVTVVYDQFYATPRVYLFGYSEDDHSKPLIKDEMLEDVYAENREKTVTVDPHPVLNAPCISIHPCRHAETMQRILKRMETRMEDEQEEAEVPEADRVPFVFPTYMSLFVFLKFISSVVPTISYDISIELDM